jgi:hypothetical protein
VRPVFVWALVVVAVPILALFGSGLLTDTDIDGSIRLAIAPFYVLGAWVAPIVLARQLIRRRVPPGDAIVAALRLAVAVLAVDLTVLLVVDGGPPLVLFPVLQVALLLVILVWDRARSNKPPPRPGTQ